MNATARIRLTLSLGVSIALVFLWLALRDTDPELIIASLRQANPAYIPLIAAALMLQFWFKAVRWRILLQPVIQTSNARVFPATVVGYLANLVFPLYLGEIARIYLLARQLNISYSAVLSTAVLERLFEFLTVMFFVGLILFSDDKAPPELNQIGLFAGVASIIIGAAVVSLIRWTSFFKSIIRAVAGRASSSAAEAIIGQLDLAVTGLQSVRRLRQLGGIVLMSLLQLGAMGACVYLGILGIGIDVPYSAGVVVLALTMMAVILPSSPGFFGTIQLCFTIGLSAYGVAASEAFAASVFFHLTIYVTGWAAGLYFLQRSGLTIRSLKRASTRNLEENA